MRKLILLIIISINVYSQEYFIVNHTNFNIFSDDYIKKINNRLKEYSEENNTTIKIAVNICFLNFEKKSIFSLKLEDCLTENEHLGSYKVYEFGIDISGFKPIMYPVFNYICSDDYLDTNIKTKPNLYLDWLGINLNMLYNDYSIGQKSNEVYFTENIVEKILSYDKILRQDTIKIYVERTHTGEHSTTGTLRTDDYTIMGYTVELPRGTDEQCKQNCNAGKKPPYLNCHSIIEGTYNFEINTTSGEKTEYHNNKSLRIIDAIPNGRGGILVHKGRDDAEGWSMGCILPMPNEPVKNCGYMCNGRQNIQDESLAFTLKIVNWVRQREASIKARNSKAKIIRKIIITKKF